MMECLCGGQYLVPNEDGSQHCHCCGQDIDKKALSGSDAGEGVGQP